MAATKDNSLPVRTFGGCTSDGEVLGSLFDSDVGDPVRSSEIRREYYAEIGTVEGTWREQQSVEARDNWHDQADGFYE